MPEHMIAGGDEGSTPSPDMVRMAPGLGLTNNFIIDQHFRQRDRLGSLLDRACVQSVRGRYRTR